ncbi:hypothetical protein OAA44_02810 [Candidatus Pelagibacter sp.]|nr:hypothetical protein [Candidatus Pelagibacter sp.]
MAETVTTIQQPAPIFEEGAKSYLDLLTAQTEAAGALKPLGDTPTTRAEGFAPGVEAQSALQQAAQQQAATQGGLGTLSFNQDTGAISGVGSGTGIAGFQPFLDQAGTQAGLGQASLQTGLGNVQAGLSDIGTASTTLGGVPSYISGAAGYSGPNAYTSFQSPYQTAVRDATLTAFDDQAQARKQGISDQAVVSGNFGGGREGVQLAEYDRKSDMDRALLQAQLNQQGFTQANQLASQAFGQQGQLAGLQGNLASQQAGLGTQRGAIGQAQAGIGGQQLGASQIQQQMAALQPSLAGQQVAQLSGIAGQDLQYRQAVEDSARQAEQMRQMEPLQRVDRFGQGLTGVMGGLGSVTTQEGGASPVQSPLAAGVSTGIGALSLGKLFGL